MNQEVPLAGGRITPGVVRIGETVRRPVTSSSAFVAQLLTHLESTGFTGAPRYRGVDDKGRDTFTFIPGSVPTKFKHFTDDQISAAGALLRTWHDATRDSELTGDYPVVCHHDAGPNNFVFQNDLPSAFIDFDLASPGNPLEDIGYMAWLWCISSKPDRQPVGEQASQIRILLDGYELNEAKRTAVFDAIIERQSWNVGFWHYYLVHPDPKVATNQQTTERIEWTRP
jgi:hypothetical protein